MGGALVIMQKQIDVQDLRKGMYVARLDRPWTGTPFIFQGFEIRSDEQIEQLQRLCRHVYIDLALDSQFSLLRVKTEVGGKDSMSSIATRSQLNPKHADILKPVHGQHAVAPHYLDITTVEEELGVARALELSARDLAYTIMDDVRLGHSVDSKGARDMIAGMVDSIVRNPDALVWLTNLRNKDQYTALHSVRVAILALAFGRHLGLSTEELNILGVGALLHDIGKLKISNEIINKPGQLTKQEYEIMKSHVPNGVRILETTHGIPQAAIEVARRHHERYRGTGYAHGVSGDQIGLFGLIGAIVDTYDAVTSDRAYHHGISAYDALAMLYEARDKEYHGGLVNQFIQCMGIYPIGSVVEMNTGTIGVVVTVNRQRRLRPKVALVFDAEKRSFPDGTIIDLAHTGNKKNGPIIEIRRVLDAGMSGIDPAHYLTTIS